jgi:hypothetical protein
MIRVVHSGENRRESRYDTLAGFIEAEYDVARELADNIDNVHDAPPYDTKQRPVVWTDEVIKYHTLSREDDMEYLGLIADAYYECYHVQPMLK